MWRTGVYGSILLALILYLSMLPLGKSSSCIDKNDPCPDHDDPTLNCCSELTCMHGLCKGCKSRGHRCSNTWQNCCKGLWCDNGGHCITCKGIAGVCTVDVQCCENLACTELGECVSCISGTEDCSDQTCCEGFMCASRARVPPAARVPPTTSVFPA